MTIETVALVSCVKEKRSGPCPAKDLYESALFRKSRSYAEQKADRWFILSAKYGLLAPDQVVDSYELTLKDMGVAQRRQWAARVHQQMETAGLLHEGASFIWLAGRTYQEHLSALLRGYVQSDPLKGLQIGRRLAWLKATEAEQFLMAEKREEYDMGSRC